MRLVLIVAMAANRVIGRDNRLPWRIAADLGRFRQLTMGRPMIMGRRTFQSIGRPLAGRTSIVVTRDPAFAAEGAVVVHGLEDAMAAARAVAAGDGVDQAAVIGGAQIYAQTLPLVERIHLTEVQAEPEGDARFPLLDQGRWRETWRQAHPAAGDAPAFSFVILERVAVE